MPDEIEPTSPGEGNEAPAAPAAPATPAPTLTLTPDQIRATPEFRALEKQNRTLARQAGTAEAALAANRQEAEESRQAAEAERQAALERQLYERLGSDPSVVAAYQEIAELSANDPVAAALRVAELVGSARAQSPPIPAATAATGTSQEAGQVAANANASAAPPPPPPSQGLDGGAPLGQASTGEDLDQIVSDLTKTYTDTVARNQDMRSRNRVTMRDRASAMIAYVGAAYLKAGAKPKSGS